MKFLKEKLWIIVFLIILGTISSFALEFIANKTEPIISRNKVLELKKGVLTVLNIPFREDNLEKVYKGYIVSQKLKGKDVYRSKRDRSVALEISGPGFWANIKALIGLKDDLRTITGFYVLEQEETPGLGGRISEKEFLYQFKGKSIKPEFFVVKAGTSKGHINKVDAITGATMTSRAVEKLINKNLQEW